MSWGVALCGGSFSMCGKRGLVFGRSDPVWGGERSHEGACGLCPYVVLFHTCCTDTSAYGVTTSDNRHHRACGQ